MKSSLTLLKAATLALLLGVPLTLAQAGTTQAGATLVYTVKAGDTLYRIATERGLKPEDLLRLNNLSDATLSVGQTLKIPSGAASQATTPSAPPAPASASPAPAPSTPPPAGILAATGNVVAGVTVRAPTRLRMGDGFVLHLSGEKAAQAEVSFPSEVGEDVRKPAEVLTPIGAAGEYLVLGRVVLGKITPLTYMVKIGSDVLKGSIPVSALDQPIQHLVFPKAITDRLTATERPAEEKIVEAAYALRTPQAWSRPFAAPLSSLEVASSFGQPRTYVAGGPVLYHYGTDFLAKVGTPIRAVNDGKVVIAGTYPVRGGLVAIDHGAGLVSLYFHQSKVLVKVGQTVTRGQIIGQIGSTGISTAPHLHLEMRVRGEATLSTEYFGKLWP